MRISQSVPLPYLLDQINKLFIYPTTEELVNESHIQRKYSNKNVVKIDINKKY